MKPHIERMNKELEDLKEKLEKGYSFLNSENVNNIIDSQQKLLLVQQLIVMEEYSDILSQRIKYDLEKEKTNEESK